MAKMSDGFQSLKQSAGRMGESVKAKTVETRVNMIVNRTVQGVEANATGGNSAVGGVV